MAGGGSDGDVPAGEVVPASGSALSVRERDRLGILEAVIERGLRSFLEVGGALLEVRDSRLYRETHSSFGAYVRERWDMGHSHAYRLIGAVEQVELNEQAISEADPESVPNGDIPTTPKSEAQARELVGIENSAYELLREDNLIERDERDEPDADLSKNDTT